MNLSKEQLDNIQLLAGELLSPHDIAIKLNLPVDEFIEACTDRTSDVYYAYQRGKVEVKHTFAKNVVKYMKLGSPKAEQDYTRLEKLRP